MRTAFLIFLAFAPNTALATPQISTVDLRSGASQLVPAKGVQAAVVDDGAVADVAIRADGVLISAHHGGRAQVTIFTAGESMRVQVRVQGRRRPALAEEAEEIGPHGGRRISQARCGPVFSDSGAARNFDLAQTMLRSGQFAEAIERLREVTRSDPSAAMVHVLLGSAWARVRDQEEGAKHFETFVLSCPDSPEAGAIRELLRTFDLAQGA